MNYYYNPYYPWPYYPPQYEYRYCPCCGRPYDRGYTRGSTNADHNRAIVLDWYNKFLENTESAGEHEKKHKESTDSGQFSPETK